MKNLILLLLFIPLLSFGQKAPVLDFGIIEPTVVEVDSLSKEQIYDRVNSWVNNTYRSPEDVLKVNNLSQIRLRALDKCFFQSIALGKVCYNVYYNLTIDIKEGRYRFSFDFDRISYQLLDPAFRFQVYYKKPGTLRRGKGAALAVETANQSIAALYNSIFYEVSGLSKKDEDW